MLKTQQEFSECGYLEDRGEVFDKLVTQDKKYLLGQILLGLQTSLISFFQKRNQKLFNI